MNTVSIDRACAAFLARVCADNQAEVSLCTDLDSVRSSARMAVVAALHAQDAACHALRAAQTEADLENARAAQASAVRARHWATLALERARQCTISASTSLT